MHTLIIRQTPRLSKHRNDATTEGVEGAPPPSTVLDKPAMSTSDRELFKPPHRQPTDPALRLDDASDRVVILAGNVIDRLHADDDPEPEDLADLRTALDDVGDVLDDLDGEGDE